ncbi:MAG: 3-hydroxylacyl-ACP dehydratase [Treponema sp.]|nr:3-hydroxylacyl-ACP dehydratase [Candidatus Treponema equifaecale]
MVIEHEELGTLIPHKGKMFLVERITEADAENWKIQSETKITENFMFYDKNLDAVPNYACFEIIAQTISALTGLYVREKGLPPNIGFILSVSNLKFDFDSIKPGQVVGVKAEREAEMDNVHSFTATVLLDGKEAGRGKLTVMEAAE